MTCTTRLHLCHEGIPLIGVVAATRTELIVTMIEPYASASARRHLPVLALRGPQRGGYADAGGGLSALGQSSAEALLVEIFEDESLVARSRAAVRGLLDRHGEKLEVRFAALVRQAEGALSARAPLDDAQFYALRRALRRDLRQGLDARVYERRHRALKLRREAQHEVHRHALDAAAELVGSLLGWAAEPTLVFALPEGPSLPACSACRRHVATYGRAANVRLAAALRTCRIVCTFSRTG
ncbi:MAG: hypothetical protein IT371_08025 [Deltaproteobacteria bacterium]|nr:hypothetical protein [Deltaproteobacteria bacterium]